ncbi:uncharacterized protein LOC144067368 [Stigmatopora argus]
MDSDRRPIHLKGTFLRPPLTAIGRSYRRPFTVQTDWTSFLHQWQQMSQQVHLDLLVCVSATKMEASDIQVASMRLQERRLGQIKFSLFSPNMQFFLCTQNTRSLEVAGDETEQDQVFPVAPPACPENSHP